MATIDITDLGDEDRALVVRLVERLRAMHRGDSRCGSPAALRATLGSLPKIDPALVDELEREIEAGKLPIRHEGIFDGDTE